MVDYLKINGKEYPVKVCWGAICEFCEVMGVTKMTDLAMISDASPLQITQLLWICLWYGAKAEGLQEPTISPQELLSDLQHHELMEFLHIFGKRFGRPEEDEDAEVDKKKAL